MAKTCINCNYDSFEEEYDTCPMRKMPYPVYPSVEEDDEG